jgi:hypothetical protein
MKKFPFHLQGPSLACEEKQFPVKMAQEAILKAKMVSKMFTNQI